MTDHFESHSTSLSSPAVMLLPVTPDDSSDLAWASRALNVAQAGFVTVTTVEGATAQVYIAAGIPFPLRARRVWATGTTAAGIVALS